MSVSLNLTQSDVQTVLRGFLLGVLPSGVEVVRGQDSRVSEPLGLGGDFIVMTPILRQRLDTNVVYYADCAFTGQVNDTRLDVTNVQFGAIFLGSPVFHQDVLPGTTIAAFVGSSGGVGAYDLDTSNGTVGLSLMAAGTFLAMQPTEITIQLDIHGPNSSDYSQIISTLFRDNYAVEQFKVLDTPPDGWPASVIYTAMAPLYADDPRQMPFQNAEQQWEYRWVVDACIQANQVVTVPQQFADIVNIQLVLADKGAGGAVGGIASSQGGYAISKSREGKSQ